MSEKITFEDFPQRRFERRQLGAEDVELWAAPLDPSPARVSALHTLLAEDERARAARFRFERDRRRSIVARGLLRLLLEGYTGVPAREHRFVYGDKEKPSLDGELGESLHFNVSHSHELVLIGFLRDREVGVDVEHVREMPDGRSIAEHFFSTPEREDLAQVDDDHLPDAFFRCWTRKEAYVKAVGDGLSIPLDCFDVTLKPEDPVRFLSMHGDAERAAGWSLYHLEPADGYLGAVALEGRGFRLRGFRVDPDRLEIG